MIFNFRFCIPLILFLSTFHTIYGQVDKLRTTAVSFKFKGDYGWKEWGEWQEANVLVTIDRETRRITIYSSDKQVYDIAEVEGERIDEDGDVHYSFFCVDKDGLECRVRLVTLHSSNGEKQLYIDYNDVKIVYSIYMLD